MCGDPWLKNGCATNFETRPRFRAVVFLIFTDLFNVFLRYFFAGRNAAGCSTKYILWIFQKARPRRHFSVFGSSSKKKNPPIWEKIDATHFFCNVLIYFIYLLILLLSLLLYLLLCFNVFLICSIYFCLVCFYFFIFPYFRGNSLIQGLALILRNVNFFHDYFSRKNMKFIFPHLPGEGC